MTSPLLARILPFAAFMLFIAGEEALSYLHRHDLIDLSESFRIWLYLPKVGVTGIVLFWFRKHYVEIIPRELRNLQQTLLSFATGGIIFGLWINMDWTLSSQATPAGLDPNVIRSEAGRWLVIGLRCTGATIVVPIMEELFWRSFLVRYLINSDFMSVAIGRLTWYSLIATTLLFGLEHHYLLAGMMAGLLFSLVYWMTKSIAQCILCHAVANLCLSLYVLATGQWHFW
jgi:CAAX prenyl protease-like protein